MQTGVKVESVLRGIAGNLAAFSFVTNMLALVLPLYLLQVYDRVLPSSSINTLIYISLLAIAALALLGILEAVRSIYVGRMANRLDIVIGPLAVQALADDPAGPQKASEILKGLVSLRAFLAGRAVFTIFDLPFAPLFMVMLYFVHPVLCLITFLGMALLVIIALFNQVLAVRASKKAMAVPDRPADLAQAYANSAEVMRAMGMTPSISARWRTAMVNSLDGADGAGSTAATLSGISKAIRMMLQLAILGVGAWLVLDGQMTAGMIFASSIVSGRALQPIDQAIASWRQIADARSAWTTVNNGIAAFSARQERYRNHGAPKGRISVRDISYLVRSNRGSTVPVIRTLNLNVPAGSVVAMIGPSGAGKSTLLRMMAGALAPTTGAIEYDGADIADWDPADRGRHVGYVEQAVRLLPGSIGENIARFRPDATREDIEAAARKAHAHDMIMSLADDYGSRVGSDGVMLSGGQLQQIALARAFFGEPALLLLDEPNASLDSDGRVAFAGAIDAARQAGRTVVMVTQRDDVLSMVDAVIVVEAGTIADYGPRDEVLRRRVEQLAKRAGRTSPLRPAAESAPANANTTIAATDYTVPTQRETATSQSPFAGFGPGLKPLRAMPPAGGQNG